MPRREHDLSIQEGAGGGLLLAVTSAGCISNEWLGTWGYINGIWCYDSGIWWYNWAYDATTEHMMLQLGIWWYNYWDRQNSHAITVVADDTHEFQTLYTVTTGTALFRTWMWGPANTGDQQNTMHILSSLTQLTAHSKGNIHTRKRWSLILLLEGELRQTWQPMPE